VTIWLIFQPWPRFYLEKQVFSPGFFQRKSSKIIADKSPNPVSGKKLFDFPNSDFLNIGYLEGYPATSGIGKCVPKGAAYL